ncbi:hypothetical protein FHS39_002418 [Streptomyces olivoverticillatus]|uniref:Subtilisin inhibitor domain-containing protein n=1 Tax=Streptomyces olivoverticillatus TaxID=66427 RepID=A0A7W7PKM8_9ACTN|nr:SSI family serine proteinase inhibitor [Streptomyces olivoverticillatus]MBB4893387.1 hypothetical protein [Streptomyces olivoverticillatus]
MSVRATAAAATAATTLLALPLTPATADERDGGRLLLTVSGSRNTWIRGVRLECPAPKGHHPHGAEACASLKAAHGRPEGLTADRSRACTQEEDPVTATADGDWEGSRIAWRKVFPNACVLDAETGPVFRF